MSNGAQQASTGATYRMLRELGSRAQHSYAAIREPGELVVAQRFVRATAMSGAGSERGEHAASTATPLDAEAMALLLRDARCLAKNWHLNIARVRHVDLAAAPRSELTIATELLDGVTLAELFEAARPERSSPRDPLLPIPVLVRVVLDVLAGLNALHGVRDGMNAPLGAIHGELCPVNVVVGKDGVARLVNVLRRRPFRVERRSEAVGYAAPEAFDGDGTDDPRSDVYAVGAMLWEGLAGRRLYEERDPARILSRQREGEVTPPVIHPSSPFARLSDVAMRALAFDPSLRFRGAADMATELRKIAGTRLAGGTVVATLVSELAGERIRMRRALLDPSVSGTRRRASDRSILAAEQAAREERERREYNERRIQREVGEELAELAHKMEPSAPSSRSSAVVPAIQVALAEVLDDDDLFEDDDLPGPRGSSPELDVEAAMMMLAQQSAAARASAPRSAPPAPPSESPPPRESARPVAPVAAVAPIAAVAPPAPVSPVAPNLPVTGLPASAGPATTRALISAALALTTANMRAVAAERAAAPPNNPTPGDFVIPIDVAETLNEPPPAHRIGRGLALYAMAAALLLAAMAAFVGLRNGAAPRGAPTLAAPPPAPVIMEGALPTDPTAITTTPAARSTASATAEPSAHPAARPAPPAPPPAASAKPKKSIYDPDGL